MPGAFVKHGEREVRVLAKVIQTVTFAEGV